MTTQTFRIEVKNLNCNFDNLRDRLDKINPGFILEKDTFIYTNGNEELLDRLKTLRGRLSDAGHSVLVVRC